MDQSDWLKLADEAFAASDAALMLGKHGASWLSLSAAAFARAWAFSGMMLPRGEPNLGWPTYENMAAHDAMFAIKWIVHTVKDPNTYYQTLGLIWLSARRQV